MEFTTVIYDCDGVMFDSFDANFEFYQRVLQQCGLPPLDRNDADTMRILHTFSNRDVMAHLFPGEEERAEALRQCAAIDYRDLVPFMRMEEGLRETLDLLIGRVNLAVCTNRASSMEMLLEDFGLAPYFSCVMTAAKVRNPKPHPEPLLKVLEHFQIAPSEALFIGDSEVDQAAAEAAGVPFVAYKAEMPAFAVIHRHEEVLSFL